MPTLQSTIQSLAETFASDLVNALRSLSLEEILGATGKTAATGATPAPKKRGRPAGSKNGATQGSAPISADAIVALLKKHKSGLRAELLRRELGAAKPAFNYHVAKAFADKRIKKTGKKRATTYFAT